MSLDYVNKGEAVKASTINSIIDTLGGNQMMSPDLNVTTTARGPQVSMPSNFGGPNHRPYEILELNRYMLSAWPMMMIQLGPQIDDCLGAIRLHKADGTTATSISAAVVFKNSEDCPTGSDLSGYLLSAESFGQDAAAHAAGWMPTMIEDIYPGGWLQAQLWKYDDGMKLATVFTNVDDAAQVQGQLSTLLEEGGADSSALSSIEKIDGWNLASSTSISGLATHEIVKKRGTIDVYESESFDYDVVLKASLVCIKVQKSEPDPETGEQEIESTTWAWQIPLGPGADSDDGKAHSPNVTYGGNPVVFEVEEEEVGEDYSGDATYSNGVITYGEFTAQAGEEVEAGELWLNLSYEYQDKCVKGTFSDSQSSGSYTQDGILSRNVFVVSAKPFTPDTDVEKGSKASVEALTYGTWGVLPKDGPKLDSYCKKDSQTEFKSLDWADREGEVVECQCAELYEFDQLETVDPLSTDHLVIRRPDDNDGAELKYISLSALEISGMYVPPDADVEDAETSSIQTRELDNEDKVIEFFQFHDPATVDLRLSDLLSVDIVVRNPNNGAPFVEYGKLCIDIQPDTRGISGQKSIDWLSSTNDLQLYKFDEAGLTSAFEPDVTVNSNRESLLPDDYEFVLRKNGAGGEVTYGQVSLSVKMEELSGDSQVSRQKSISVDNNVIKLYKMGEAGQEVSSEVPTSFEAYKNPLDDVASDCEIVIRKGGAGGEIDYAKLKLKQAKLSTDTEAYPNQKSLEWLTADGKTFLQLNGFNAAGTSLPVAELSSEAKNLLPTDNEFVIRKKVNGSWQIAYAPLSAKISATVEVDSDIVQTQRSIEWAEDDGQEYLQLYDMDVAGQQLPKKTITMSADGFTPLLPNNYEFVLREDGAGGKIRYANLSCCIPDLSALSASAVSGDTNVTSNYQSIETIYDSMTGERYHQLYNFAGSTGCIGIEPIPFYDPFEGCTIGCTIDFAVRVPNNGGGYHLEFVPLHLYQYHERVDAWQAFPRGCSLQYVDYDNGDGCEQTLELYNFDYGCSNFVTSADISADSGNAILIRRNNGCSWYLDYMNFDSVDEMVKKYIGDYQLSQPPHNPYNYSTNVFWDSYDSKYAIELYNWQSGYDSQSLTIHNDGCTYFWPQGDRTDSSPTDFDYVLVKHVDSTGNQELQYKLLQVTMPDIQDYGQDINDIYNYINDYGDEIVYLSGCIDDLSGHLSGDYWESGGDSSTCYGSDIGNSSGNSVIDLDGQSFAGNWYSSGTFEASELMSNNGVYSVDGYYFTGGCSYILDNYALFASDVEVGGTLTVGCQIVVGCSWINSGGAYVDGTITANLGCQFQVGCSYLSDGTLRLGNTTLTENQLQRLLQLI